MLLLWLGCTAPDDSAAPASSPCDEEDRAGPLEVGQGFEGESLGLTLLALEPDPAAVGNNTWTLDLGLEGCSALVSPLMPDHGHGGGVGEVSLDGETLRIEELFLSMGGYWEVQVDLSCPTVEEAILLTLCVEP